MILLVTRHAELVSASCVSGSRQNKTLKRVQGDGEVELSE
jgi:hypothetical protein